MNRNQRRKAKALGAMKVLFLEGQDGDGASVAWFWQAADAADTSPHGPFDTRAAAQRDAERALFGSGVTIIDGGPLRQRPGESMN